MVISRTRFSSPAGSYSPLPIDQGWHAAPGQELDLEEMPDEIDLLAVLWSLIRCYRLQFHPVTHPGH